MPAPHESPSEQVVHAPHAPLTEYYQTEAQRSQWVRTIFNRTAVDYDRIESILGFGSGPWYRHQALQRAGLAPGMRTVDVGVGTGLVARQAASIVGDPTLVTGVDPSAGMLEHAQVPAGVSLVMGSAEQIPFENDHFDFLSMGYALRHISDISVAFNEFYRVLKPGARFCILEISRPSKAWQRFLFKTYLRTIVPILARFAGKSRDTAVLWRYYWDTIEFCAAPEDVMATLRHAGFVDVTRDVELGLFSEYRGIKPLTA